MTDIFHALVLNLHQPAGNLDALLDSPGTEWETKEILWALDRMPRAVWPYEDVARIHLNLSGTLLETLSDPAFQQRVYGIADCGSMLWHYQNRHIFKILGGAFYHPVLPLTPPADWDEQLRRWQGIARHLFWRTEFSGFWPPEMGFCMELIPVLKRFGYRYVLVDSNNVEPVGKMRWHELRYRPHIARYGDDEIIVVVRDRELSDAQESGMEFGWFYHELHERTKHCDFAPLVTTCTDGDNGGWFRNTNDKGNFWGVFYREFMERLRAEESAARPIFIDDYLDRFGHAGEVTVKTAAWNTGDHTGEDFVQWTGSSEQKRGLARVAAVSEAFHQLADSIDTLTEPVDELVSEIEQARWHLLRAETSCNFFWGAAWVGRAHDDLDITEAHLARIERLRSRALRRGSSFFQPADAAVEPARPTSEP